RIKEALIGVADDVEGPFYGASVFERISSPPSYLVFMALCVVGDFVTYRVEEKSAWQVFVTFQNSRFEISDWKKTSWGISCLEDSQENRETATKLRRKIQSACSILDRSLATYLQKEISKGDFFIHNVYHRVRGLFETFRDQTLETRMEIEKETDRSKTREFKESVEKSLKPVHVGNLLVHEDVVMSDFFTGLRRLERKELDNGTAMIAFYFSYLEFVFDVLFAFKDAKSYNYNGFRALDWSGRFKQVLDFSKDVELSNLYNELLGIRRTCRNVVLHGYADDSALLVPFPRFGLIPVRYSEFERSAHYSPFSIQRQDLDGAMETFSEFDKWLENHDESFFPIEYARSGLEIPVAEERVAEIKSNMTSREDFLDYLHRRAMYEDYLSEQYSI
ncbi:MAG: hypothetical protein ACE5KV_06030, partial [Thermoplasmata archaeon]